MDRTYAKPVKGPSHTDTRTHYQASLSPRFPLHTPIKNAHHPIIPHPNHPPPSIRTPRNLRHSKVLLGRQRRGRQDRVVRLERHEGVAEVKFALRGHVGGGGCGGCEGGVGCVEGWRLVWAVGSDGMMRRR